MPDENRWYRKAFGNIWTGEEREFQALENSYTMSKSNVILQLEEQRQESLKRMRDFEEKLALEGWGKLKHPSIDINSVPKRLKPNPSALVNVEASNSQGERAQIADLARWEEKEGLIRAIADPSHVEKDHATTISVGETTKPGESHSADVPVGSARQSAHANVNYPKVPVLAKVSQNNSSNSTDSTNSSGSSVGNNNNNKNNNNSILEKAEDTLPRNVESNFIEVSNSSLSSSQIAAAHISEGERILSSPEKAKDISEEKLQPISKDVSPSISFSKVRFNMGNLKKSQKKEKDVLDKENERVADANVNNSIGKGTRTYSEKTLQTIQSNLRI